MLAQMRDNDKLIGDYETMVTNLLTWIQKTNEELSDTTFPNTIAEVQTLVMEFNQFRTAEKPPKYIGCSIMYIYVIRFNYVHTYIYTYVHTYIRLYIAFAVKL